MFCVTPQTDLSKINEILFPTISMIVKMLLFSFYILHLLLLNEDTSPDLNLTIFLQS